MTNDIFLGTRDDPGIGCVNEDIDHLIFALWDESMVIHHISGGEEHTLDFDKGDIRLEFTPEDAVRLAKQILTFYGK